MFDAHEGHGIEPRSSRDVASVRTLSSPDFFFKLMAMINSCTVLRLQFCFIMATLFFVASFQNQPSVGNNTRSSLYALDLADSD